MSQPLDVALFRKIKIHWRTHLHEYTQKNPTVPVNLTNFPKIYIPVLIKSLSEAKTAIQHGFKTTGIIPIPIYIS